MPSSLALAVLAGFGADGLQAGLRRGQRRALRRTAARAKFALPAIGLLLVGLLLISVVEYRAVGEDFLFMSSQAGPLDVADRYLLVIRTLNGLALAVLIATLVTLSLCSGDLGEQNFSAIILQGKTVTTSQCGVLLAVLEPRTLDVILSDGFDTYLRPMKSERLAAVVSSIESGSLVVITTQDEATRS